MRFPQLISSIKDEGMDVLCCYIP